MPVDHNAFLGLKAERLAGRASLKLESMSC
jgi:hypothetical protein